MENNQLKVCFICSSFYPAWIYGGPTYSNYMLAKNLAAQQVNVQVLTTNANGTKRLDIDTSINHKQEENFWIKYFHETIIGRFSLSFLFGTAKYTQESKIVHVTDLFSTTFLSGRRQLAKSTTKMVVTPRGVLARWGLKNKSTLKTLWLNYFIRPIVPKILFHATAEKEKADILRIFPNATITIIPNGITNSTPEQIQRAKKHFPILLKKFGIIYNEKTKFLCSMGRIHKKKGFDILIEAFHFLKSSDVNMQLIIAGPDEGELTALQKMVEAYDLKKSIHFIGLIEGKDKDSLLAGSDLFVLPSHDENFGNVYLEALNLGTPIIASKNTPWEAIEKHQCGKWIDNDIQTVAKAINELLSSDLDTLSKNAIAYAKQFSHQLTSAKMKAAYLNFLK